ncbi:MAG: restriction endonuclease subunit S [Pseudomonadales bacterium]|nr:restriction endonuclease subunit S [Pseudomonadales bacterium]
MSNLRALWKSAGGSVPDHWEFKTIENLLEHSKSISVGVMYPGQDTEGGIPLVKVSNVKNGAIASRPEFCVSEEVDKEYKRTRLNGTELLLTLVGNPGDCVVVTEEMAGWNVARALAVVRLADIELRSWLRYVLLSKPAKHLIDSRLNTTVQKTLNLKDVRELGLPIPPKDERERITLIIDAIEKKSLINSQANQTLENIAQTIFKSWFVDFEPTRAKIVAKENGKDPERAAMAAISGLSIANDAAGAITDLNNLPPEQQQSLKSTAALFPDTLTDSELGEIPEGWGVKSLSEIINVIGGGTPKRSEKTYWNGDIPWFSVKDAPSLSDIFVIDTIEKISDIGLQKSSTKLLPVGTTIITARGTVGKLALVATPMCMNQSCYGIIGVDGIGPYFNYFNLREAISTLQRNTHGAVFDTITTQTFESYLMPIDIGELTAEYEKNVAPLLDRIESNNREITVLAGLRDSLLPKLLSGELEITEMEKVVANG